MNKFFENDPWALLEAEVATDPTLHSFDAAAAGCAFDLSSVPHRADIEAAFTRQNLKGESWEWMGVRIGVFTHNQKRYHLEFFAPFSPDFLMSQAICEKHAEFQPARIDDDLVLAVLAELPNCNWIQPCIQAEVNGATIWYAMIASKPDCNLSRFVAIRRQDF